MLRTGLARVARRIQPVMVTSAVPRAIVAPWTVSSDMDVIVTFFTSTSLCSIWPATTCETRWVWLSSVINWVSQLCERK